MLTWSKPDFKTGDSVVSRKRNIWVPGIIVNKLKNYPRSYIVRKQNGQELRRNSYHLRKSIFQGYNHRYSDNDDIIEEYMINEVRKVE